MAQPEIEGFLLLHKPSGITSFDCLRRIKKLLPGKLKVGHGGTLDAFASGLLVVGLSRAATRHMDTLLSLDKQYSVVGVLGAQTDTMDRTGTIIKRCDYSEITVQQLTDAAHSFIGGYKQIPPIFSALKHRGQRLSDLVRSGQMSVEQVAVLTGHKARDVMIYSLDVAGIEFPEFSFSVHVSHGTYIRSLVVDIADRLGTCAYTAKLSRTSVGPFLLNAAIELSRLDSLEQLAQALMPIDQFLQTLTAYKASSKDTL